MAHELLGRAEALQGEMTAFLRDIVAIPSTSGNEEAVVRRIAAEMEKVGFDEVMFDGLGNVLGRVGDGERVLAFDAHIDTVDVTDGDLWCCDPYAGKLENGNIYGRGVVDQKAGMAAMVYAGRILQETGVPAGCRVWMVGTVMEEDCDGLCWDYILREGVLKPELVVSTEPTDMGLYRGQRGRMEIRVETRGRSAHGSMPHLGDNAVYKLYPAFEAIRKLDGRLADDEFLGKGTCAVTMIKSHGPSLCAIPDGAELHIDRRLTTGETEESALAEVRDVLAAAGAEATVRTLTYEVPSWTGHVHPMPKYYPTWVLPEGDPVVRAGANAFAEVLGREPRVGRWTFSTNGVAIRGLHGVPCIGLGPGREDLAHQRDEHVPVRDLVECCAVYAGMVGVFAGR